MNLASITLSWIYAFIWSFLPFLGGGFVLGINEK